MAERLAKVYWILPSPMLSTLYARLEDTFPPASSHNWLLRSGECMLANMQYSLSMLYLTTAQYMYVTLLLADAGQQALTALENLHDLGWLHRCCDAPCRPACDIHMLSHHAFCYADVGICLPA